MKLFSYKTIIFISLALFFSCKEPSDIGLNIQPTEDRITIKNDDGFFDFEISTQSVDSLRSDEPSRILLGNLSQDQIFPNSNAYFITNLLLQSNNISLGDLSSIVVDSVVLQYAIEDMYGDDIQSFSNIYVSKLSSRIYKDSIYYSNKSILFDESELISLNNKILQDSNSIPVIKISIDKSIGQDIIDGDIDGALTSNDNFLEYFYGLIITTVDPSNPNLATDNTILYLNPDNEKSKFSIFYRDLSTPDSLRIFNLSTGGNAARVNLFNKKSIQQLLISTDSCYIQSMSGYNTSINFRNLQSIRDTLKNKVINKASLKFICNSDFQYAPHDKLFLLRKNIQGNNIFLSDFLIEGESHFGGKNEDNNFIFNITRYFSDLIKNESGFTKELILTPSGSVINSNRSIIPKSSFQLEVYYSEM